VSGQRGGRPGHQIGIPRSLDGCHRQFGSGKSHRIFETRLRAVEPREREFTGVRQSCRSSRRWYGAAALMLSREIHEFQSVNCPGTCVTDPRKKSDRHLTTAICQGNFSVAPEGQHAVFYQITVCWCSLSSRRNQFFGLFFGTPLDSANRSVAPFRQARQRHRAGFSRGRFELRQHSVRITASTPLNNSFADYRH